jgi:hypothetical protein
LAMPDEMAKYKCRQVWMGTLQEWASTVLGDDMDVGTGKEKQMKTAINDGEEEGRTMKSEVVGRVKTWGCSCLESGVRYQMGWMDGD